MSKLQVRVTHPSGRVEITTDDEIREAYDMSLEEYLFFVSTEPTGSAARSRREKERREEVASGNAQPFSYSHVWTVDNEWATSAAIEFLPSDAEGQHEDLDGDSPVQAQRTILDMKASGIRSRASYNSTPLGPNYTAEERKNKWQRPGTYPGHLSRGQLGAKTRYFVHTKTTRHGMQISVIQKPSFADKLISGIPSESGKRDKRLYWEKAMLGEYYHLYGAGWNEWAKLLPWVPQQLVAARAEKLGIDGPWRSLVKVDVLRKRGLSWSPVDIEKLVAWYPNRQITAEEQRIFIGGKSFDEISAVARVLHLPTRTELDRLESQAEAL